MPIVENPRNAGEKFLIPAGWKVMFWHANGKPRGLIREVPVGPPPKEGARTYTVEVRDVATVDGAEKGRPWRILDPSGFWHAMGPKGLPCNHELAFKTFESAAHHVERNIARAEKRREQGAKS